MSSRREGREAAIQLLYAQDINQEFSLEEQQYFWDLHNAKGKAKKFALSLVEGFLKHQKEIDSIIDKTTENYSFERISVIERNILRISLYEMLYIRENPPVVCINEAIEISKILGTEKSGGFINGILDKIYQNSEHYPI